MLLSNQSNVRVVFRRANGAPVALILRAGEARRVGDEGAIIHALADGPSAITFQTFTAV